MSLSFFDANVAVGRPQRAPLFQPVASPGALDDYLSGQGFDGALIWHWAQADIHPESANPLLTPYRALRHDVRVAWALLPPAPAEQPEILARIAAENVFAVRLFPQVHRYVMDAVVWGDLLAQVSASRLPVLLSLQHGVTWEQVYGLLADFPDLTCILCDIGTWSVDRYTYPLLATYERVYVETSMLAIEDGGLEAGVAAFGAERFIFGTGFPERYAEAAALQLTHAALDEDAKQAIASGNLMSLLAQRGN